MIEPDRIVRLDVSSKEEALTAMIDLLAKAPQVTDAEAFGKAILDRERQMSTGIGSGIAIPHAKTSACKGFVLGLARMEKPLEFDSADRKPVQLVFMIGASENQAGANLRLLAKLAKVLQDESTRTWFYKENDTVAVHRKLSELLEDFS